MSKYATLCGIRKLLFKKLLRISAAIKLHMCCVREDSLTGIATTINWKIYSDNTMQKANKDKETAGLLIDLQQMHKMDKIDNAYRPRLMFYRISCGLLI